MKNTFLALLLFVLLFSGCKNGNREAPDVELTSTREESTTPTADSYTQATDNWEGKEEQSTDPEILGVYTNGWHDESWALFIDESNGEYRAWGVENDGMLPAAEGIFNYPDDFPFVGFETFKFDPETMTFTSDWGPGKFTEEGVRFLEKEGLYTEDEEDTSLLLYKRSRAYSNEDLIGFYSGSTWHSQGYIVTIEAKGDKLMIMGAPTEGGKPRPEDVVNYPDKYELQAMPDFTFTDDNTRFTSEWGTGRVQESPFGFALVFDKLPGSFDPGMDKEDIQVRLYRYTEAANK